MALLTHTHTLPRPPSLSGKFSVAPPAARAPDPYSKLYQGISGGRHEHIERVNRYVAHKGVKVSQRLTDVGRCTALPSMHLKCFILILNHE